MRTIRVVPFSVVLCAAVICASGNAAVACSHSKLALDYCGDPPRERPPQEPINRPDFSDNRRSAPDPHPVIVTPRDSRGIERRGIGIEKKF